MTKTQIKHTITKGEKDLINLSIGKKKPKNEKDRKLSTQIEEIKKKGGQIYIPHD